ncbi:MAG: SDR family oxidoreductase [Deltaproteobacteria bacterium]|nr:SDR family oxidoreductase [Deltaproteobacteria bacterium]
MTGKVALITGGTSGIGKATAQAFVRSGAKVVICGRNAERGQEVVTELKAMPGDALFVKADVSKAVEVEALVATTVSTYGRLDYAANIAGIGAYATTVECTEKLWDLIMRVNVKSLWLSMKYEIPHILKQGGAIVNMSSITGLVGLVGQPAYAASKHAIIGLTKTAALEYAKSGIRINAICPGSILTPMQDPVIQGDPEIEAQIGARHPIGRMGTAEEVAAAIHWLCSDAASFVTGAAMTVDGGYVAQ